MTGKQVNNSCDSTASSHTDQGILSIDDCTMMISYPSMQDCAVTRSESLRRYL